MSPLGLNFWTALSNLEILVPSAIAKIEGTDTSWYVWPVLLEMTGEKTWKKEKERS